MTVITSTLCLASVTGVAQVQSSPSRTTSTVLLKVHPVASAGERRKALMLLTQLFEPETVAVNAGTRVEDLSRAHCGHVDADWIRLLRADNPTVTGRQITEKSSLSLPPCPFWGTGRDVEIREGGTLSQQLWSHMGTLGSKTLDQVASINDLPLESLNNVKAGDSVTLPYTTAYSAYKLKPQYQGDTAGVANLLQQVPGYVSNMPQRNMQLIVAATNGDCAPTTNPSEWPFSTTKLRAVLQYNNTKRSHPPLTAVIAVADTGLGLDEDRVSLRTNEREIPDNNIDDDDNGYTDDVKGANMDAGVTGFPLLNNGYMYAAHGTHVSGLALGGLSDDELTKLVKQRVQIEVINLVRMDVTAGATSGSPQMMFTLPNNYLLDAFRYASQDPAAQIINLSVEDETSSGIDEALAGTTSLVVAAAGNDGINVDENERYPAAAKNRDRLISVAAYDGSGGLPLFSNWGSSNVDLAAPGCQVDSILPGGKRGKLNGTSQAAPLVSFAAALLYSEGLTIPQIKNRILQTTDFDHSNLGICSANHHCVASEGRLDIVKALNIYQDLLTIRKGGSTQLVLGRAINCVSLDGHCYDARTELKRLVRDPATNDCRVWIKSRGNQTHGRQCQIDASANVDFQETGAPKSRPIPLSDVVEFIPAVY
jgi:hypothetical protein